MMRTGMCCLLWPHAEVIEVSAWAQMWFLCKRCDFCAKVSTEGVFQSAAWGGFPLLFPLSMFLLLFVCGHYQGAVGAKGHPNHPQRCPPSLHFPLHNPCATTAGRNALPSPAAALKAPSQFIFPLNCAQLSVPVAGPAARRAWAAPPRPPVIPASLP